MNLTFTPSGWGDYQWIQEHDRKLVKRINLLIREILRTPFEGIGKPEPLKGDLYLTRPKLTHCRATVVPSLRRRDVLSAERQDYSS